MEPPNFYLIVGHDGRRILGRMIVQCEGHGVSRVLSTRTFVLGPTLAPLQAGPSDHPLGFRQILVNSPILDISGESAVPLCFCRAF